MLSLINITKNNNNIEADYIPENSGKSAHISLDIETGDYVADEIEEYGSEYSRMAANGLLRTLEELKSQKRKNLPKNRVVMWY